MDEVVRRHAFEPFFTTKGPARGTGLGLSTVYGIVTQSGGWIWLYSEPGKGTTFKLYFPRSLGELDEDGDGPVASARPTEGTTVLLVEDEPQLRLLVCTILERAGYAVHVAADPLEALEIANAHIGEIDLLLTDVLMPHMNGKVLAEKLEPLHPKMRVLYMSGYTENTIVHHGDIDEGVNFLSKPITQDRLLAKVASVLAERR
jgi:CheY-like chemotaxis protein